MITMKTLLALAATAATFAIAAPANAALIDFDDIALQPQQQLFLTSYAGLDWFNAYAYDNTVSAPSLRNLQASLPNAVFNGGGGNMGFSSTTPFTFNSAFFATTVNETITVRGFSDTAATIELFSTTITLTGTPTQFTFEWAGLGSVRTFTNGNIYVMDDLLINDAGGGVVPEPATWAMLIGGAGATGSALRRRRARVAVRYA